MKYSILCESEWVVWVSMWVREREREVHVCENVTDWLTERGSPISELWRGIKLGAGVPTTLNMLVYSVNVFETELMCETILCRWKKLTVTNIPLYVSLWCVSWATRMSTKVCCRPCIPPRGRRTSPDCYTRRGDSHWRERTTPLCSQTAAPTMYVMWNKCREQEATLGRSVLEILCSWSICERLRKGVTWSRKSFLSRVGHEIHLDKGFTR